MSPNGSHDLFAAPAAERVGIHASWLIKLRWVAAFGQLITIAAATLVIHVSIRVGPLLMALAITVASNVLLTLWIHGRPASSTVGPSSRFAAGHRMLGCVMWLDLAVLTAMLYVTGGLANPFSVFFFVNLVLAAIVLPSRWAWGLTVFAVLCLVLLFFEHLPLAALQQPGRIARYLGASGITLGQEGLLVALLACGTVIVYFTTRVTTALRQREADLRQAEFVRARSEKLESLGTLAAGAAHELATPLSTIAVIVREVERELQGKDVPPSLNEDIHVIRDELDRCRNILDRMSTDAGQSIGEAMTHNTVADVLAATLRDFPQRDQVQLTYDDHAESTLVTIPLHGMAQVLRGVIDNACSASSNGAPVRLKVGVEDDRVRLEIRDSGHGMAAEVLQRAGEPFFTTKQPGHGMGLGLFLARSLVERLGGELKLESEAGSGTLVCIRLNVADKEPATS